MGLVKEPKGVDFYFDNTPLTEEQKKEMSEIIAYYKATGKKKRVVRYRRGTAHGGRQKAGKKALA